MKNIAKNYPLIGALLVSLNSLFAQVEVIPKWFDATDSIEIIYNSTEGNKALAGSSPIYGHFGLLTDQSVDSTDWKYVVGNWGQADAQVRTQAKGHGIFEFGYQISSFHSLPANESFNALAMVFRNADGSVIGKNSDQSDFILYGSDGSFQSEFTSHSANSQDVLASTSLELRGESSVAASLRILKDGQVVAQSASSKVLEYSFDGSTNNAGTYSITLEVDTGSGYFQTDAITANRVAEGAAVAQPAGREDGITILSPNKVHLQLRAPGKTWAFVLGDFNNWQLDSTYLMTPSTDGQTFWIEIDNLDPQTKYRFQYYVGPEGIKIADPYSELILDPWNDQSIDQATYPNRPTYPSNQSGFVSVFQTGKVGYAWDNSINYQRPDSRDLVIYELLIRDFDERHTFQSVIDRLDYLEELNINALQLMPVMEFEGNESWGYNPSHMLATDKYYGPEEDLKRLIEECHRRGIAVIMDITLNHQFGQSPLCRLYWDDVNNRPAANSPWFNPIPKHPYNVGYDMNHESSHTQYFSKRVFDYWLKEFRVDGFRVDLSKGFTQTDNLNSVAGWNAYDQGRINRLNDYGAHVWNTTPGAYMILEHFSENAEESALSNNGFMLWGDMNYSYNQTVLGFGSDLSGTLASNRGWWGKNLIAYMESHDEERIAYEAKEYGHSYNGYNVRDLATYADRNAMGAVLLLSTPGPKMMWQFGELAYDYSIDFCMNDSTISSGCHITNKPIRWDYYDDPDRKAAFDLWANMIYLRTTQNAFRNNPVDYYMASLVKTIRLQDFNRHFVIVANTDVATQYPSTYFPVTGKWYSLLESDSIQVGSNFQNLTLAPGEYKVFCNDKIPLPNAPFSPDLVPDYVGLCDTDGELLTATAGFGPYTWSNGSIGQSLTVTQDGWYSVSVSNSFGDVYTDSVWVNIDCATPALATYNASLITANSASFDGELISSGSSAVSAVGFVYGTSSNPTLADSSVSLSPSGNSFSANVTGLIPSITYYVRSFASNTAGTAYGNERTFTTATGNFDLTFRVDMSEEVIDPNGIFVAGDFQQLAGFTNNWDPMACQMTDADQDSVYEFTVTLPVGTYEYKFINGNSWVGGETLTGPCANSNDNRSLNLTTNFSTTPVCFESCSPCDTSASSDFMLTFKVDMTNETVSPNGVHVAGSWQALAGYAADWDPSSSMMTDADADGIYELTVTLPAGTYEYKFVNGNAWGSDESVPLGCNTNNNRSIDVIGDMSTPSFCYESCAPCNAAPLPDVDITFQLDMSNSIISANGIHVAGDFQQLAGNATNWDPAGTQMTDPDGDSIYTVTVTVPAGTYQYKFINGNAWRSDESVPSACANSSNRQLTATGDMTTSLVCFSSCAPCSNIPPAALYNLTFQVDMSQDSVSANGIHVAGNFQNAAGFGADWNPAGSPMTDLNGDGIYELTVQIPAGIYEYKFINGNSWLEEESLPGYCTFNNNRGLVFGSDTTLPAVCFSACDPCSVIPDNSHLLTFSVDMSREVVDTAGVFVTGNFAIAAGLDSVNWRANGLELLDPDGDSIYEATITVPTGVYEYKFVNGKFWGQDEQITGSCVAGMNRVIMVNTDRSLATVCFANCISCQALPPPPANYSVTFVVDMSNQTVSADGVHIAGDFQVTAGFPNDWDPSSTEMLDLDGDSIYEYTVILPSGNYEYKFINGNTWNGGESITGLGCSVNGNRSLQLSSDTILDNSCFASCAPCGVLPSSVDLTFQVDMSQETISPLGIHIAGDFQIAAGYASNWDPSLTELTDSDGDGVYTLTVNIPVGTYFYKFINGNAWGSDESVPLACNTNNNRIVNLTADMVTPLVCYESCSPCVTGPIPNVDITFQVNMTNETVSADGVHVAGDFQNAAGFGADWDPTSTELTDADGDGIYTLTVNVPAGTYQYKFINGNAWGSDESVPAACAAGFNRQATLASDTVLSAVCFASCSPCQLSIPSVSTSMAQNIGLSTATVGGEVISDGGDVVSTRGVIYSTMPWPYSSADTTVEGSGLGLFSSSLVGLMPATTYYYRAYATNGQGTSYGAEMSFTTSVQINAPTVNTSMALSVGTNTALLGGDVVNDGGAVVTARGVIYSTSPWPYTSADTTSEGMGLGSFTSSVMGLSASTTYYYRAYATNSQGTSYGSEMSFATTVQTTAPTVSTSAPQAMTSNSAVLGGTVISDGGQALSRVGICISTQAGASINDRVIESSLSLGAFDLLVDSLTIGTTYYFNAFAENSQGVSYGTESSFSLAACPAMLTVDSVLAINANKGIYRAYFGDLTGDDFRLQYKAVADTGWRTKTIDDGLLGSQKFNLTPSFGTTVNLRLSVQVGGVWTNGCEFNMDVPCKNQALNIVVQKGAFCAGDSVLLRAGYAGGYGAPNILWSNGSTNKRTYAQQGETLSVVITDAAGCSISDSITAPSLDLTAVPTNFTLTKPGATVFQGSWNASVIPAGASLIGYRMAYRLRGTQTFTNTSLSTDTFATFDFTGSGLAAGNYEFVAFARYNNGTRNVNSEFTCREARGYNGSGNKSESSNGEQIEGLVYSIYPNPTSDVVYISTAVGTKIELLNIQGQSILRTVSREAETQLDLSHLANAVYMLRLESDSNFAIEQIVKD